MFRWFKKGAEAQHAPDPMEQKPDATTKEQVEIAELQSQLALQRADRNKAYDELLKYEANREKLAEEYRAASSPIRKEMLLNSVQEMDEDAKGIHQTLTIAQSNIKDIRKTLREKYNIKTADEGDVGKTIDLEKHAQDIVNAGRRVAETKAQRSVSSNANNDLIASFDSENEGKSPVELAEELSGNANHASTQEARLPETLPPPPSMFASQG